MTPLPRVSPLVSPLVWIRSGYLRQTEFFRTLALNVDLITGWFPVTVVVVSLASVVLSAVPGLIAQHYGESKADDAHDPVSVHTPDGDLSFASWAAAFKTSLL
jgi:hypothetical protein